MADDYSEGGRNWTWLLIGVMAIIVIILLASGFYINHNRIDNLSKSLQQTQKQLQEAKQKQAENQEMKKEVVQGIDNPATRLALIRAYAASINPLLSSARQKDLEAVIVYVNGHPEALVTKNPTLPSDIVQAVANVKAAVKNLKVPAAATAQVDNATYTFGEVVNLTGTLSYVGEDEELGGSIFTLTDSSGNTYYLNFNDTNSQAIKNTMLDQQVSVTVKVTNHVGEPLTFQVTKGPILVSTTATPTKAVAATPTP